MFAEDVRVLILKDLPEAHVEVQDYTGGGDHFQAVIVAEQFNGLTMLKQHKLIYQSLQSYIDDGRIHALALKTYTPEQWKHASVQLDL